MTAFFRRAQQDERGAALMGVVLISTFVFIVMLSLAGTAAVGTGITAGSRSSIKAFTAAEAGRDTVLMGLSQGECSSTGTVTANNTTPGYTYRVFRYRSTAGEIPTRTNQSGVEYGCPNSTSTHVLIESSGRDVRSVKTIVATYAWQVVETSGNSTEFNSAVASGNNLTISGFSIYTPSGAPYTADLTVAQGIFKCEGGGTSINGSVYVLNGRVDQLDGCNTIRGNISVGGNLNVNSWNRRVDGNGCAMGQITNFGSNSFGGSVRSWQQRSACEGLDLEPWVEYNPTLSPAPADWDVIRLTNNNQCRYDSNNWQNNGVHDLVEIIKGYPYHTQPQNGRGDRYLEPLSRPTIIDATNCNQVQITNGVSGGFRIPTDITIVANSFAIQNQNFSSTNSTERMINFVTPDKTTTSPAAITCSSGQGSMALQSNTMQSTVYGLIYSPCSNSQMTGTYRGQIYMGAFNSNASNGSLTYIPVPAPGGSSTGGGGGSSESRASTTLLSQTEPS